MKLINRHWEITDAVGNIEIVDGPGVVGQQPILNPGESFEYNSFCSVVCWISNQYSHSVLHVSYSAWSVRTMTMTRMRNF